MDTILFQFISVKNFARLFRDKGVYVFIVEVITASIILTTKLNYSLHNAQVKSRLKYGIESFGKCLAIKKSTHSSKGRWMMGAKSRSYC